MTDTENEADETHRVLMMEARRPIGASLAALAFAVALLAPGSVPAHAQKPGKPQEVGPRPWLDQDDEIVAEVGGIAPIFTAADVQALITTAAQALSDPGMTVAVVDRVGAILGVYRRPASNDFAADVAVSLARTGAFFSAPWI